MAARLSTPTFQKNPGDKKIPGEVASCAAFSPKCSEGFFFSSYLWGSGEAKPQSNSSGTHCRLLLLSESPWILRGGWKACGPRVWGLLGLFHTPPFPHPPSCPAISRSPQNSVESGEARSRWGGLRALLDLELVAEILEEAV